MYGETYVIEIARNIPFIVFYTYKSYLKNSKIFWTFLHLKKLILFLYELRTLRFTFLHTKNDSSSV